METLSQKSSKNRMFCFVDGCFTTSARNKNLGFHQFPASERKTVVKITKNGIKRLVNRRQLWIEALNIDKEATTVIDQMRVCSLHFSKKDFIAKDKRRPFGFLKDTAVPRRNLPLRKNSKLTTSLQFRNFNRIKWRGRLAFQDPDGRLPVSRRRYLGSHRKGFGVPNVRPVSTKNEATQSEERTYSEICEGEDLGGGKIQLKTFSLSGRDKLEFVKELKEQTVDGGNDVKCDDDNDVQFTMEKSDTLPQPVMSYEIEIKEEPLSDVEQCQDSQDNYSWEAGEPTGDVNQIGDDNVPADASAEKNQEDSEDIDAALEEEAEEEEEEDDEGSEEDEEDDDVSEGNDKNVRWRDRPCKICGKVDCKGHSTGHLNKKAFVCIVCDDIFESQELLDRHSRIHKQKNSKSLTAREQMYHQQKELTCKVCKKVLATRLTLKEHMLIHTGEKPHVCMLCGRTFRHKANLVVHINAHTIVRTFECPMCPETFSMRVDLEDHKKTHTDQQHTCSICKDSFQSKRALWTHQQIHNKRTQRKKRRSGRKTGLPCRLCGKMLSTKNTLKEHMMIHSGEKPHECLLCGKTIRHKANFIIHVQSHSNSEVFSCDLCDLEFSKKNDLRHHKSESHGSKSFSCILCGAVFRKEESLMHHVESRHGDNPSSKTENEEEFEELGNAFQPHMLEGLG